ncbi:MAG: hypothetical protein AAGL49_08490, partial [Pseudomonadota bacterium]
ANARALAAEHAVAVHHRPAGDGRRLVGECSGIGDFAQPKWRLLNRVTADWAVVALNAQVRILGPLTNAFAATIDDLAAARVPVEAYADFGLAVRPAAGVRVIAGVENAFDNGPPILGFGFTGRGGGSDANTDPSLYDVVGRRAYLAFEIEF